jgi:hypothetical protein
MPRPASTSAEQTFVVRISAVAGPSPDSLRGMVVHVTSGERLYITSYGELCSFIDARRDPEGV